MKIYFTASIVGKDKYLANYGKIISLLNRDNNIVTSEHIMSASENKITMQSEEKRERFHAKLKKWIMDAQCMVVETSFPSISVGFEISLALNLNKPVLVLYTNNPPLFFQAIMTKK